MPYIKQEFRDFLESSLEELIRNIEFLISTRDSGNKLKSGVITYVVYRLINDLYNKNCGQISYDVLSDAIKVLECTKLEFYRRIIASYETTKQEENGDI